LLGDQVRSGCAAATLSARADADALRAALTAEVAVGVIVLSGGAASPESMALAAGGGTVATLDSAEELAMKMGFAEQLEADFWGTGDDDDDDE